MKKREEIDPAEHAKLLREIKEQVEKSSMKKSPLSAELVQKILDANDERAFVYLVNQACSTEGIKGIPILLQDEVLKRAGDCEDVFFTYVERYPFAEKLHRKLWNILKQDRVKMMFYVSQYPLENSVLDRFWDVTDELEKLCYVCSHEIDKEMGMKVWNDIETDAALLEWARIYASFHPIPKGLLALVVNQPAKDYDLADLIDVSHEPFYPEDEVVLMGQEREFVEFYINKFGKLCPEAQLVLLEKGNEKKARYYAENGVWCPDAQKIIAQKFRKGDNLAEFIVANLQEPFEEEL